MSRTGFGSASSRALKGSLTLAGYRYVQAASMSARRARRLPAKVRPFRRIVSPVERSAGTRPRKDISCLGVSNRRPAPISAAKVTATRNEAPRIAWSRPPPFRDRDCVLLLGDVESHEDFAILSHGPPSVHEARLGMPEQPSFLPARKGGPPAQPANMTSREFRKTRRVSPLWRRTIC